VVVLTMSIWHENGLHKNSCTATAAKVQPRDQVEAKIKKGDEIETAARSWRRGNAD
jgi:hypothetical protein